MQVATEKSILNGIAIGPLRIYKKEEIQTAQISNRPPAQEWERFESACAKAKEQLAGLYEKALDEVGEDNAAIFEIHQMMLEETRTIWMPSRVSSTPREPLLNTPPRLPARTFPLPLPPWRMPICRLGQPMSKTFPGG